MEAVRLILTGARDSGKSSLCAELAGRMRSDGWDVAGMISHAVVSGDRKTAFLAELLRTGDRRRLAVLHGEVGELGGPAIGGWRFDAGTLAWCNAGLEQAVPCDLLVVDEFGPLEFLQTDGLLSGLSAIDSGAFKLAVAVVRPGLLQHARERWPGMHSLEIGGAAEIPARVSQIIAWAETGYDAAVFAP